MLLSRIVPSCWLSQVWSVALAARTSLPPDGVMFVLSRISICLVPSSQSFKLDSGTRNKFLEPQSFFPFQPFVPIPCWIVSDAVRPIRYLTSLQTVVLFTCPSSLIVHSILLTQGKLLARTHGETQAAQLLLVTTLRQDASQGDSGYPCGLQLAGLRRRGPARVSDPPTHTSPLFLQTDSGILFLARLFPSPLVLALRCTKRPRP